MISVGDLVVDVMKDTIDAFGLNIYVYNNRIVSQSPKYLLRISTNDFLAVVIDVDTKHKSIKVNDSMRSCGLGE